MRAGRDNTAGKIIIIITGLLMVLVAVKIAPYTGSFSDFLFGMEHIADNPLSFKFCRNTLPCVFVFLLIYLVFAAYALSVKKNYRGRFSHGSASWGSVKFTRKKYADIKNYENNKILTYNVWIRNNTRKLRRNKHTLVDGGSGAGKSRFVAKPNLLQANTSYIVLDPKGELLRDCGELLKLKGYKIKVIDMVDFECSDGFNPFWYIKSDFDVQTIAENFFKATTPADSSNTLDHFWDDMAKVLLKAIISYLYYVAPAYEQNFPMVCYMLRHVLVSEEDEEYKSPVDVIFDELAEKEPDNIAVAYWQQFKSAAGKTAKSVIATLNLRLEKFNVAQFADICKNDEIEIEKIGTEKTALFLKIPSNKTDFNFWASLFYTCAFQELMRVADSKYKGVLPVEVHFLMDEFANVETPADFDKIISVARSYNISITIFVQALSQLKAKFKDDLYKVIIGNCDEFLYLGGNEDESFKYVSEMLGDETIDTTSSSRQGGLLGTYSVNYQQTGRRLIMPNEVREIDDDHCVLLIRGEKPIFDVKYDLLKHPNVRFTPDGGGKEYVLQKKTGIFEGLTDFAIVTDPAAYYDDDVAYLPRERVAEYLLQHDNAEGGFYDDADIVRRYYNAVKN